MKAIQIFQDPAACLQSVHQGGSNMSLHLQNDAGHVDDHVQLLDLELDVELVENSGVNDQVQRLEQWSR